jgi:hypothetical protein
MKFGVTFWACATQTKEASAKKQSVILNGRGGIAIAKLMAVVEKQDNLWGIFINVC